MPISTLGAETIITAAGGLLATVLSAVVGGLAWAARRMLGADGLLTRATDRHLELVDQVVENVNRNSDTQEKLLRAQVDILELETKLSGHVVDLTGELKTHHGNCLLQATASREAMLESLIIVKKFASALDVDVEDELSEVRRKLDGR